MKKITSVEIDGEKLRKEFIIRNLLFSDVASSCGFEKSYFSKACRFNRISKPAINLIDRIYNIKYEDYKIDDPIDEVVADEVKTVDNSFTITEITEGASKALYDIIYSAVYEAVKKAWAE